MAERSSRRWGLSTTLSHISFRIRCALAFLSLDSTTEDSLEGPARKRRTVAQRVNVKRQQSLDDSFLSVLNDDLPVYLVWWRCSVLGWSQWRQWWVTPQQGLKWSQCHHLVDNKWYSLATLYKLHNYNENVFNKKRQLLRPTKKMTIIKMSKICTVAVTVTQGKYWISLTSIAFSYYPV